MTFDNNNSLKPTRKEEGVTQTGLIEKKVKDIEDQIDDIKDRLTPLENTVEGFENEVNTESVIADQVHSGHDYTDALSVSGDADVQGTISAAKVTVADIEVSNKVKTKDIKVTGKIEASEAVFGELSAETIDIENFNVDELNAEEIVSENVDTTNLAADNLTAENVTLKDVTSETLETDSLTVNDKITGKDAELSGKLEAGSVESAEVKVSNELDALKVISETMQTGRVFVAPEQMFLIPENGWIHFHNVNAGRFILYLTDFTDITTNIHSLGNVKFSAVIDYVNNSERGAVKVLYVQPELKSFEAVYIADNGEIWFKRSPQYLNARRAVVFAESEKELVVDTFAENAQTFDVSEAKSITLRNFNNDDEIVKEKFLKGDYTIDGNVRITGFLTPGQVISERALFLGYSDYVTADSDGILSAKGAVIDGNLSVVNDATINGDNTVVGNETIGGTLSVTGNTDLDADLNVDGETTLNDDVTVTGDVSVTGTLGITGDVTLGEDLSVSGNTVLHETEINGELKVDADINAAASVHVDKDVSVKGDLYVQGVTYQTEETNVSTTGDYIVTRDNNNTPLGNGEYSGLAVNNYDTGKIATLTADSNGEWRVSDSATVTAQTYTNVSEFNGGWYSGITQTAVTALKGIFTNISGDELTDVVLYNGSDYYHFDGVTWYGTVSVSNGKLVKGNAVTDAALITALEGLTKHTLVYYASVTVKEIDASTNQPLLTRDEAVNLTNDDVLIWDDTGKKAVGSNAFQKKNLANAVEGATTVEGALGALSTNKASKVSGATADNLASLDANGNLVDSGRNKDAVPNIFYNANTDHTSDSARKTAIEYVIQNIFGLTLVNSSKELHFIIRYDRGYYYNYIIIISVINTYFNYKIIEQNEKTDILYNWDGSVANDVFTATLKETYIISDVYSTSETKTGATWIDGKPIYRRVFYSATNWPDNTVVGTINDLDTVVNVLSTSCSSTNTWYTNYDDNASHNYAGVSTSGQVKVYRAVSFVTNKPALVIIEYTKTTD